MKETKIVKRMLLVSLVACCSVVQAQESGWQQYSSVTRENVYKDHTGIYREAGGALTYPFIPPGSEFDPDMTTHKPMNVDQPSYKVIMFGNSLTANGKWSDGVGRSDVKNSGTPGFTTSHFVWIIKDKVLQYTPTICFLEGGINDIGVGIPLERTYENYTSLVDTLLAHNIIPVIQSTLYTNFPNNASQTTHHNQMVESLNTFLKELATSRGIVYLDLNKFFSENKKLKPAYTQDGVHVNAEAYKIWYEEVKRILKEKGA